MTAKKETATSTAAKQVEDAVAVGKKTVEQAMQASTEGYEQAMSMTKEQVEKASAAFFKGYGEMSSLNKETVDAVVKAGDVLAKGAETVGKAYFDYAQASAEASVEATKALMGAKTVKDMVDIQSEFARTSFDNFMAESTRISELTVKLANDAFAPIQAQVNATFEKTFKFPAL